MKGERETISNPLLARPQLSARRTSQLPRYAPTARTSFHAVSVLRLECVAVAVALLDLVAADVLVEVAVAEPVFALD